MAVAIQMKRSVRAWGMVVKRSGHSMGTWRWPMEFWPAGVNAAGDVILAGVLRVRERGENSEMRG